VNLIPAIVYEATVVGDDRLPDDRRDAVYTAPPLPPQPLFASLIKAMCSARSAACRESGWAALIGGLALASVRSAARSPG
jgi:hypothetical protein